MFPDRFICAGNTYVFWQKIFNVIVFKKEAVYKTKMNCYTVYGIKRVGEYNNMVYFQTNNVSLRYTENIREFTSSSL